MNDVRKSKSTFRIADVLERVNTMLSKKHNHTNPSLELMLETILMDSGNYQGWQASNGGKFYHVADSLKPEYLKFQSLRDNTGCR